MTIENIHIDLLGRLVADLVARQVTFFASPNADGSWTIRLLGGF